jgi:poly(A) polymerase
MTTARAGGAIKLPKADWQFRPGLRHLLDTLGAGDGDTRYVGGCVRDTILAASVSDIDLATRLTPLDVLERLRGGGIKAVPTGLAHGTVTAVVAGQPVEVTTLRRDLSTDGRHATIAFTDDWKEDAARRDFTINALSADPSSGKVHDYFDGRADLHAGRVRFIGEPLQRIAEDRLRILRFFRFHSRFGRGEADGAALDACTARANDLMALSRERIADELLKLLALPDPAPTLVLMVARGILKPVIPEIAAADRLAALVPLEAAAGLAGDPVRRLAALLPPDPDTAASVAARLKLSNKAAKRLVSASRRETAAPAVLAYRIGRDEAVDRLLLAAGDSSAAASLAGWEKPRLRFGGGDLIAMGLEKGPVVAATVQALERTWAEAGFPEDAESQRALARAAVDQALRASQ